MSEFLTKLTVTEVDDSVFQVAYAAFKYKSDLLPGIIEVPIGFQTDFASVPRLGMIYAMLGDIAHEPAVIHDYIYATEITDRAKADNILLEAMDVIGVPWWRRWPIYLGVRAGGWYAWNQHRKQGNLSVAARVISHDPPPPTPAPGGSASRPEGR